jgi:hypothetical protein
MSNYCYIPPAQKQLLCRLSLTPKDHEIAFHTGISIYTVQRVLNLWRQMGGVNRKPLNGGRPRVRTGYPISVCLEVHNGAYPNCVRDHHIQHMRSAVHYTYAKVPGFSTDISNFLISWQGREHLAQRVGRSQLLPVFG